MASRIAMYVVAPNAALAVAADVEQDRAVLPNAASAAFARTIADAAMEPPPVLWTHPRRKHEVTQL